MKKTFKIVLLIISIYLVIGMLVWAFLTQNPNREYSAINLGGGEVRPPSGVISITIQWPRFVVRYIDEIRSEPEEKMQLRLSCNETGGKWTWGSCGPTTRPSCSHLEWDQKDILGFSFGCSASSSYVCSCQPGTCWDGGKCVNGQKYWEL